MSPRTRIWLWSLCSGLIGLAAGAYLYAQTVERAHMVASTCVLVTQALDSGLMPPAQVRAWGRATGQALQRDYGTVASKLRLSDAAAQAASPDSPCSQFLLGLHEASPR